MATVGYAHLVRLVILNLSIKIMKHDVIGHINDYKIM